MGGPAYHGWTHRPRSEGGTDPIPAAAIDDGYYLQVNAFHTPNVPQSIPDSTWTSLSFPESDWNGGGALDGVTTADDISFSIPALNSNGTVWGFWVEVEWDYLTDFSTVATFSVRALPWQRDCQAESRMTLSGVWIASVDISREIEVRQDSGSSVDVLSCRLAIKFLGTVFGGGPDAT